MQHAPDEGNSVQITDHRDARVGWKSQETRLTTLEDPKTAHHSNTLAKFIDLFPTATYQSTAIILCSACLTLALGDGGTARAARQLRGAATRCSPCGFLDHE